MAEQVNAWEQFNDCADALDELVFALSEACDGEELVEATYIDGELAKIAAAHDALQRAGGKMAAWIRTVAE